MPAQRHDAIDALRGSAMVWMTLFHFSFDLNHFGVTQQDFYNDPFWTWQRSAIVSLFLCCAGLGQAMALQQGQGWPRFWRRWGQVAGCALLVSIGSWFMFPHSFIYFGVLHGIALMLLLVRVTAAWGRWLWLAGGVALLLGLWVGPSVAAQPSMDFLNSRAWNWLGLISRKPVTEDHVPMLPWMGVVWWGMAGGQWLSRYQAEALARPLPALRVLSWLGRWSLSWYMLHQPLLIGALTLWMAIK